MFPFWSFLVAHRTILATARCDVQLGSHGSSAVAVRNLDFATTQLKRFIASRCPFIDIAKDGSFSNMHAYFEKCSLAIEASKRSTKSLDFSETLKELTT